MGTAIIYRPAVLSDVLKLSVLYGTTYIQAYGVDGVSDEYANYITMQYAPQRLQDTISREPGHIVVAEYRGNLVGVAEIALNKQCPVGDLVCAEFSKLYVLDRFCSRGIGGKLLSEAENIMRSKGQAEVWVWAWDQNPRAITFYQRQGYQILGPANCPMEQNNYINIVLSKKL